jgi:hypothetical protein
MNGGGPLSTNRNAGRKTYTFANPHRGPHSSSLTTGMTEVNHAAHFRRHTMPHRGPLPSFLTTRMNGSRPRSTTVTQTPHHAPPATHTHHDHTRPYDPQHDYRQYKNKDYKPSTKTTTKTPTARNHTQKFSERITYPLRFPNPPIDADTCHTTHQTQHKSHQPKQLRTNQCVTQLIKPITNLTNQSNSEQTRTPSRPPGLPSVNPQE